MKKILFGLSLLVFIIVLFNHIKTDSKPIWQGAYYEHGKEESEVYGPIFNNFNGCKEWALGKIVYADDTVACSKNCHSALGDGTPVCEEVVRNWAPFSTSQTFYNYQE